VVQKVNAVKFGLTARTDLEKTGRNHYSIVINRKSRLLLKDGEKILEKINLMREFVPGAKIDLTTNAPVCSKATKFLIDNGIDIISI
jgi:hypothetical protein